MPGGGKIIKAEVPLSEMFGYCGPRCAPDVAGRATYTMEFKLPPRRSWNVADAIIPRRVRK